MSHVKTVLTAMKENQEYRQCDLVALTHLTSGDISKVMKMLVDGSLVDMRYSSEEKYKKRKVKKYKSRQQELRL